MKTNLTLAIDEDLLREARKLALDRKTTVNQMVRGYLEGEVKNRRNGQQIVERMRQTWRGSKYEIGARTWTRDELYDR